MTQYISFAKATVPNSHSNVGHQPPYPRA